MGDVQLDHVHLRVRDVDASRRFYVAVAEALEFGPINAGDGWFELGELFVSADGPVTTNLHFAFKAPDRSVVERFHAAALAAGGRDNGAPGTGRATTAATTPLTSSTRTETTSRP
jgi:catechol 2,3-dioxygenase-like lactoylglutathione lyase family enzyme